MSEKPVSFVTIKFFAYLTFVAILALCTHMLMDLFGVIRRRLGGHPVRPSHEGPGSKKPVERFDVHQRLQHGLLTLSFIVLVVTAWPLSQYRVATSRAWVDLFGGIDSCGMIHRIAAVALGLASVHHLGYLIWKASKKELRVSMLPLPSDVRDLFHNLMYFLGVRKSPPRFARFSYVEKFDYWAGFWGTVIMGVSGTLRWFPEAASRHLPPWLYEIGLHAHTDEALLAAMAIFLWHFYNVHLRPAVFPMSWVFLHGHVSVDQLKREHPREYEELLREGKIRE